MLGVLLESRARRSRRIGGGGVSVLAHGCVLGLAVMATARGPAAAATPPAVEVVKVHIDPPPPPPAAPPPLNAIAAPTSVVPAMALPILPRIDMPTILPTAIPEVRFDATPTSDDQQFAREGDAPRGVLGGNAGPTGSGGLGETLWSGSELSMRLLAKPVPPRYPDVLRQAGVEGHVLVRFVVDTTGRVDMASVEIMESTHDLFTAAVRAALPGLRFTPATIDNRKAKALAMMPFLFQLSRAP